MSLSTRDSGLVISLLITSACTNACLYFQNTQVVRVASSEYGDKFRISTSSLTKADGEIAKRESHNYSNRSPTPLPSPIRVRREPSIQQGRYGASGLWLTTRDLISSLGNHQYVITARNRIHRWVLARVQWFPIFLCRATFPASKYVRSRMKRLQHTFNEYFKTWYLAIPPSG